MQEGSTLQWNKGKLDNLLNFHANTLLPKNLPLLVSCQLMPSSHTSNVTMERAKLLVTIVENKKINLGNLIYDQMNEVFKPF